MASPEPHSGEVNTDFDLLVVSLLAAVMESASHAPVHRTTLQALVEAIQAEPEWAEDTSVIPAHAGRLRMALADTLIKLRQAGLVALNNKGFVVTDSGNELLESAGPVSAERERLLSFVGQKRQEWQITA